MSRLALAPLLLSWMAWSADALGARGVLLSQRTPLGPARSALAGLRCKEEPAAEPAAADSGDLLGGLISKEQNPYVTSKAERLRAKYGDSVVEGRSSRSGGREGLEARLEEDLAKFKSDNGLDGVKLGMGAARSLDAPEEEGLLQKVINTLGTVLTFNFFIIIIFFTWFITGVGAQFALDNVEIINAFRGAWDVIILPLLTTHMTLTFLSYGLEKMAKSDA